MLEERAFGALAEAGGGILTSRDAYSRGFSRASVRWAHQRGVLHRLHPGVFTTEAAWETADPRQRHLLKLRAALRINPRAIACGTSAAILYDLPVPEVAEPQVASAARSGRRAGVLHLRVKEAAGRPVGIRATSPVQTVLDCVRGFDRPWGLAVAEAAVFTKLITLEDLTQAVEQLPSQPGSTKARWVAEHVKSKVESPLESLGRAVIILAGLPEPEPQTWVRTRGGWYRVDMLDELNRVVTEADGKVKYTGPQAVWNEKGRQDDIRDCQLEVVRFTMANHHHPTPWLETYRRALARGRRLAG